MCGPEFDFPRLIHILSGLDFTKLCSESIRLFFSLKQFALVCLHPETIIITPWKCFRTEINQLSDTLFISEISSFFKISSCFGLLLFGLFYGLSLFSFSLNCFFFSFCSRKFSLFYFFLFALLFFLYLSKFFLNSWVIIVCHFDEAHYSGALFLYVFCSTPFIFILHVPSLVTILSFICVVFVILRKLSPTLEVVPELVEFFYIW